jgi:hypothetical protein
MAVDSVLRPELDQGALLRAGYVHGQGKVDQPPSGVGLTLEKTTIVSATTWLEVQSDGTGPGTHVYLCLRADESDEVKRYLVPGVQRVAWTCEGPRANAVLTIQLIKAHCHGSAAIRSDSTTVENMLAELAAGMLQQDGKVRWLDGTHHPYCSKAISAREGAELALCDCSQKDYP